MKKSVTAFPPLQQIGQFVTQRTPDADSTYFYYNKLGQLRFSQNAQQKVDGTYSYTRYDYLGRIIEVGESSEQATGRAFITEVNNAAFPATGTEKTVTVYTTPASITYLDGSAQRYLQNRVSFTYLDEDGENGTLTDRHYTYYSYDPHGNVEWLVQETPGLGKNYLRYEYDLLSGNVLQVVYNEGKKDQFYHKYAYDADNRILAVYTSANGHLWDQDARYEYYAHGPLKRMEVGEDHLQGIDYTYTIHGWLKAINHPVLDPNQDPGGDGLAGKKTAKDAFGMSLGYYQGDFKNTDTKYNSIAQNSDSLVHKNLYNGNISAWASNQQLNSLYVAQGNPQYSGLTGAQYDYDELNRLIASNFKQHNGTGWQDTDYADEYNTSYSYDANGNLQTLDRNAYGSNPLMDRLNYQYYYGTNKLEYVTDTEGVTFGEDLGSQSAGNYVYDKIGNLVKDNSEGIDTIAWTVYGKPKSIKKSNGDSIAFKYDAAGNRIEKYAATAADTITTFYVRDASGNIMAVYEQSGSTTSLKEQPIYGSDRIGQRQEDIVIDGSPIATSGVVYSRNLGYKRYELKDHLGNVRVVISDKRLADSVDVVANYNYYAFGLHMPGRSYESEGYRFGFNSKEKDNSFGSTNYDYGFRIYNPAIARFLSVDPIANNFPYFSPYQFAGLNPIKYVDLDGLERAYRVPGSSYIIPASDFFQHTPPPDAKLLHPGPTNDQLDKEAEFYKTTASFIPGLDIPIDGYDAYNDFSNGNYLLGTLSGLSLIPGADFITKPLKQLVKRADDIKDLVKTSGRIKKADGKLSREVIIATKTGRRTDALKVAKGAIGDLGNDAIGLPGKSTSRFPNANKTIVGVQSKDGARGYRIDYDPEKGAHYNYWNNETGEQGAVLFEGTKDQVDQLKQQLTKTYNLPKE